MKILQNPRCARRSPPPRAHIVLHRDWHTRQPPHLLARGNPPVTLRRLPHRRLAIRADIGPDNWISLPYPLKHRLRRLYAARLAARNSIPQLPCAILPHLQPSPVTSSSCDGSAANRKAPDSRKSRSTNHAPPPDT